MLRKFKSAAAVIAILVVGVAGGVYVADAQAQPPVTQPSSFRAMFPPVRVLDTRLGIGTSATKFGPAERRTVDLNAKLAELGVPDADAVILTVTVENPSAGSYLAVFPAGAVAGATSNLNFTTGWTIASQATTALNTGRFDVYNAAGSTEVVVDLAGVFVGNATTGTTTTTTGSTTTTTGTTGTTSTTGASAGEATETTEANEHHKR